MGAQRRRKGCPVRGKELKEKVSFHQIMGRMAACKDETEGISEGKKEKHELKKEGKQVWETQWFHLAEMQGARGKCRQ